MEQAEQNEPNLSREKTKAKKSVLAEVVESLVIAVLLAALIRLFVFQPFYIPSGSMEPTLQINDRIIVSKLTYRFGDPQRGDIVVFKYPLDPSRDFVKRLIAKGGETVALKDGKLFVDDREMPENYLPEGLEFNDFGPVLVPENTYFMLGDNRNNSDDGRVWGPLPEDYIIGKALLIYWPFNRVELLADAG